MTYLDGEAISLIGFIEWPLIEDWWGVSFSFYLAACNITYMPCSFLVMFIYQKKKKEKRTYMGNLIYEKDSPLVLYPKINIVWQKFPSNIALEGSSQNN